MSKRAETLMRAVFNRYTQDIHNLSTNGEDLDLEKSLNESKELGGFDKNEEINKIIKEKCRIFRSWDLRESLPRSLRKIKNSNEKSQAGLSLNNSHEQLKFTSILSEQKCKKEKKSLSQKVKTTSSNKTEPLPPALRKSKNKTQNNQVKKPKILISPEIKALKEMKKQKFKKHCKPAQFLKYCVENEEFTPTQEQKVLIQKLIFIHKLIEMQLSNSSNEKQPNLELILQKLYRIMNMAVDYNELHFLTLLIYLTADVCFFLKGYPASFYFYNQTRIAGSYARKNKLKIHGLMGMGRVCFELQFCEEAKRIYKKALQYAWRAQDQNSQLEIYDALGKILSQEGKMKQSLYFHEKYAKSLLEPANSTSKRISKQILKEYDSQILSLEDKNVSSLFLEYVHLPIDKTYGAQVRRAIQNKKFGNQNYDGQSPRMAKEKKDFSLQSFPQTKIQIQNVLQQDYEFQNEISDLDKLQTGHLSRKKRKSQNNFSLGGGKKKNHTNFESSIQFHKLMPKKIEKPDVKSELKRSLDQIIEQRMNEQLDPQWYEKMVENIKKRRIDRVGNLKQKVRNSHLSYHKYPVERKRNAIVCSQNIKQSINRTLLDWIAPII